MLLFSKNTYGIERVLDLKFGVTETSVLVMTDKSFLIIDYVNDVSLKRYKYRIYCF